MPDVILAGFAKSGTTSLANLLAASPSFSVSVPKEPEVLVRASDSDQARRLYEEVFAGSTPGQLLVDASTRYCRPGHYPLVAERMASWVTPSVVVFLLRDPVERAFSHWKQLVKNKVNWDYDLPVDPGEDFQDSAVVPEVVKESKYEDCLIAYERQIGRDNMIVHSFESFVRCPGELIRDISEVVGGDIHPWQADLPHSNNSEDFASVLAATKFFRHLGTFPGYEMLRQIVPEASRRRVRRWVHKSKAVRVLTSTPGFARLSPEFRAELRQELQSTYDYISDEWSIDVVQDWPSG